MHFYVNIRSYKPCYFSHNYFSVRIICYELTAELAREERGIHHEAYFFCFHWQAHPRCNRRNEEQDSAGNGQVQQPCPGFRRILLRLRVRPHSQRWYHRQRLSYLDRSAWRCYGSGMGTRCKRPGLDRQNSVLVIRAKNTTMLFAKSCFSLYFLFLNAFIKHILIYIKVHSSNQMHHIIFFQH